jgi:hypothetical protein
MIPVPSRIGREGETLAIARWIPPLSVSAGLTVVIGMVLPPGPTAVKVIVAPAMGEPVSVSKVPCNTHDIGVPTTKRSTYGGACAGGESDAASASVPAKCAVTVFPETLAIAR